MSHYPRSSMVLYSCNRGSFYMPVQFNVGAYGMTVSYGPHSTHEQNAKRMHSLIISFTKIGLP